MDARAIAVPLADLFQADAGARLGVDRILSVVRRHLGLSVAFVSEFRERDRIFRHVDADGPAPIAPGDALALEEGYCLKVVNGELPELIPDTARVATALRIPATAALPIGAHLSVPIRLRDGSLFGTFCCFGPVADPTLSDRDLCFMRAVADLVADCIDEDDRGRRERAARQSRIRGMLDGGGPSVVYQPIVDVRSNRIEGFECLARFDDAARRSPDHWFREAWNAGIGAELELAAIATALSALDRLPGSTYLSVNASPQLLTSGRLGPVLAGHDGRRIVVEVTEHHAIDDYTKLLAAMATLRADGIRFAIDDTGAGYSSLRHVLQLEPDKIKLDMTLTRGIDVDVKRRALAAGLIAFARETGARIVAEGVETPAERRALVGLGVDALQGYLLGRPLPLSRALALLDADESASAATA